MAPTVWKHLRAAWHREHHHAQLLPEDVGGEKVEEKIRGRVRVVNQREHRPERLRFLSVEILEEMPEGHECRGRCRQEDKYAGDGEQHDCHVSLFGFLALILLIHALLNATRRGDDFED